MSSNTFVKNEYQNAVNTCIIGESTTICYILTRKIILKITFWMKGIALFLPWQLPCLNDPQVPFALPKLANRIWVMGRPWQDNSRSLF